MNREPSYIIVLRTDGGIQMQALEMSDEPSLKLLQTLVDGYIETVPAKRGVLIVNESGKCDGLPFNANATAMLRADVRDIILGDAVLVQADGERLIGFPLRHAARIADSLREAVPV